MGSSHSNGQIASLAAGAVLSLSLSLGGCSTSSSSLMDARAETSRPGQKYLSLEDQPPAREQPEMTVEEQLKIKKQLIEARDHQAAMVKARYEDNSGSASRLLVGADGPACEVFLCVRNVDESGQ